MPQVLNLQSIKPYLDIERGLCDRQSCEIAELNWELVVKLNDNSRLFLMVEKSQIVLTPSTASAG